MKLKSKKNVASETNEQTKTNSTVHQEPAVDEQIDLFVAALVTIYFKLEHEKENNSE